MSALTVTTARRRRFSVAAAPSPRLILHAAPTARNPRGCYRWGEFCRSRPA